MNLRSACHAVIGGVLVANALFADGTIQFPSRIIITVTENAGQVDIPVVRADDVEAVVSVEYYTISGTATADEDFASASGTVTFNAGETNRTIVVPILDDGKFEGVERFQVALTNVTGGAVLGANKVRTIGIQDNETPIQLEFTTYWAREDEGSVQIGIVRGGDADSLTLEVATAAGTATAGVDYQGVQAQVTLEAGENVKLLTIPILNDGLKEPEETFRIYLTNAPAGMVGTPHTATITIRDNDPGVRFSRNALWVQEPEGSVELTVTRGNDGLLDPFTVDFATVAGTATASQDYIGTRGTLTYLAGEMTKSFGVSVLNDGVPELDERFTVTLSNPTTGMTLGGTLDTAVTVTVCDTTEMLPHRFDAMHVSEDGTVSLTLGGGFNEGLGLVNRFRPFFDIHPVEVSSDLVEWTPWTSMVRRNASTDLMFVDDPEVTLFSSRFYRTPATQLVAPSPQPTGPYAVGRLDRLLTDPDRRNRYGISTNGSFVLTLWYPALSPVGQLPAPFHDREIATDSSGLGWATRVDLLPYMFSHSFQRAPFAPTEAPCPVVFYSPGLNDWRDSGQDKAENLASHGYVAVTVDHADCMNTVFPDGTHFKGAEGRDSNVSPNGLSDRVKDFMLVREQLDEWNRNDSFLVDKLELGRIAAFGFSWGGVTAAELCRVAPWCVTAILLDPGGWSGPLPQADVSKPSLTMVRADNSDQGVFATSSVEAIWFQISSTVHYNFASWYFWDPTLSVPTGQETVGTINSYLLWFMDRHLRGSSEPIPALADHPRVINFKQK